MRTGRGEYEAFSACRRLSREREAKKLIRKDDIGFTKIHNLHLVGGGVGWCPRREHNGHAPIGGERRS